MYRFKSIIIKNAIMLELRTKHSMGRDMLSYQLGTPKVWHKTKPTTCFLEQREDMCPLVVVAHYISGQKAQAADDYRWETAARLLADFQLDEVEVVPLKRNNDYGWNDQHVKDAMNIGRQVILLVPAVDWATKLLRWAIKRNRALDVVTDNGDIICYPEHDSKVINCDKLHYKVVERIVKKLTADAAHREHMLYVTEAVAPAEMPETIVPDEQVAYELPRWARSTMSGDTRYESINYHTWEKSGQVWHKVGFRDVPKVSVKTRRGAAYPEVYQDVCEIQDSWVAQLGAADPDHLARTEMEELRAYFAELKTTIRHPRRWLRFHPEVVDKFERLGRLESIFGIIDDELDEEYTDLPEWISISKSVDTVDGNDKTAL